MEIEDIIKEFITGTYEGYPKEYSVFKSLENKKINKDIQYVYNEFSLQHELGNYLRHKLNQNDDGYTYIVKFEYNVKDLLEKNEKLETCKKEIDILIIKIGKNGEKEKYAIELKYLKNKAAPYRMFQCIKDMKFMNEILKINEIKETYCVTITENKDFYNNKNDTIVYLKDNEKLLKAYKKYKDELIKKECKDEKLKNKIEMIEKITKYSNKYPLIYEYFRKSDKNWERMNYIFSNLKNDLGIIDIEDFKNKMKFSWLSVDSKKEDDDKYYNKYYILKFEKSN